MQSCGNWKSLIVKDSSHGIRSISYPNLFFKLQNHRDSQNNLSNILVKNAENEEIAQLSLNKVNISIRTVYLHTDDFPNLESVARDVNFSVLDNEQEPSTHSSQIPNPASGFDDMSLIDLSIEIDGVLSFEEEEHSVIYKINFSRETFLYNDEKFDSFSLAEGKNKLFLNVRIPTWFHFNNTLSDATIKTELQNLGSNTEAQKTLKNEILINIQRSFVFGFDLNNDSNISEEEANNSDYFSSEN